MSDLKSGKSIIPTSAIKKYYVREVMAERPFTKKDSVLYADRLEHARTTRVEANTVLPVWFYIHVPADAKPGTYNGIVTMNADGYLRWA